MSSRMWVTMCPRTKENGQVLFQAWELVSSFAKKQFSPFRTKDDFCSATERQVRELCDALTWPVKAASRKEKGSLFEQPWKINHPLLFRGLKVLASLVCSCARCRKNRFDPKPRLQWITKSWKLITINQVSIRLRSGPGNKKNPPQLVSSCDTASFCIPNDHQSIATLNWYVPKPPRNFFLPS